MENVFTSAVWYYEEGLRKQADFSVNSVRLPETKLADCFVRGCGPRVDVINQLLIKYSLQLKVAFRHVHCHRCLPEVQHAFIE